MAVETKKTQPIVVPRYDPMRYINSPVFTIKVGKPGKQYFVHESLLIASSKFFRACLGSGFAESNTREVAFEEMEHKSFETFLHWLYGGRLVDAIPTSEKDCVFASRVYIQCNTLMAAAFNNDLIDCIRLTFNQEDKQLLPKVIAESSKHGLLGSQLGTFYIEALAWNLHDDGEYGNIDAVDEEGTQYMKYVYEDQEVAAELVKCMLSHRNKKSWENPAWQIGCFYHEHEDGESCKNEGIWVAQKPDQEVAQTTGPQERDLDSDDPY